MNNLTSKSIYLYTLPIILSELLEEVMILSDSILLSFKDPLYLSTVGIIDSVFLLFLAIGDSLNDSFQNYYARHTRDVSHCYGVFKKSVPLFIGVGLFFVLICSLFHLTHQFFEGEHYEILLSVIPYLSLLIFVSFISLSLNSLLMGWGYTKLLGYISIYSVVINISLGYVLLYVLDIGINPCAIVLITSSIAEVFAIVIMSFKILAICHQNKESKEDNRHKSLIFETLVYASVYPCISDIGFHIGSIALYSYCLCYFIDTETAIFTLFMSYWGVLQVPSQGFSETSINIFSNIYTKKLKSIYGNIKKKILYLSFTTSCIFCLAIEIIDVLFYGFDTHRLILLSIILVITGLNTFGEITETSLLVRLKNDSFMSAKLIYALVLIVCISIFTITGHAGGVSIFACFLIAQFLNCFYLNYKDKMVWLKIE